MKVKNVSSESFLKDKKKKNTEESCSSYNIQTN